MAERDETVDRLDMLIPSTGAGTALKLKYKLEEGVIEKSDAATVLTLKDADRKSDEDGDIEEKDCEGVVEKGGNEEEKEELAVEKSEKDEEAEDEGEADENSLDSQDSDSLLASSVDDFDDEDDDEDKDDQNNVWDSDNEDVEWRPGQTKEKNFEPEGPLGRLLRAVNESDYPPIKAEWTNYIMDMVESSLPVGGTESKLRRVEQLDMVSNKVIQIFAGVNAASRTTGIAIHMINSVLINKTDTAGGFKWR